MMGKFDIDVSKGDNSSYTYVIFDVLPIFTLFENVMSNEEVVALI